MELSDDITNLSKYTLKTYTKEAKTRSFRLAYGADYSLRSDIILGYTSLCWKIISVYYLLLFSSPPALATLAWVDGFQL